MFEILNFAFIILLLGVWFYALIDYNKSLRKGQLSGTDRYWIVPIFIFPFIGAFLYLFFAKKE